MKVRASVKPMCDKCQIVVRGSSKGKKIRCICSNPRHKQVQG